MKVKAEWPKIDWVELFSRGDIVVNPNNPSFRKSPYVKQYRKKPVVIEAMQFHLGKQTIDEITDFVTCECDFSTGEGEEVIGMCIPTLEGDHEVSDRDFIIKGVESEFYSCKESIFNKTYEVVSEPPFQFASEGKLGCGAWKE